MARRSSPERIREAKVAGARQRLAATGMLADRLDALWATWEAHAAARGLAQDGPAYWSALDEWIRGTQSDA
jgi:hypothetical protein